MSQARVDFVIAPPSLWEWSFVNREQKWQRESRAVQYVQMFPTERISRNNDDPRAATSKTASGRLMGSIPCPVFRQSCTRGLGRAPCTVFQLTWLNGIALAHSFHPSTRCERLASPLFSPPLRCPRPVPVIQNHPWKQPGTRCLRATREYADSPGIS